MGAAAAKPILVAIVGETASGKSALALDLAERYNGEIIAADSRTVYKGMDIGTAKPSAADRMRVPHHLIDIVNPDQPISAAAYQRLARQTILDIYARGKNVFLVGGTGLYIDAVLYNFTFRGHADQGLRARLEKMSVAELQQQLQDEGIPLPANQHNPRHLVRQLETKGVPSRRESLRPDALILGVQADPDQREQRIRQRVDHMMQLGLQAEVGTLIKTYGEYCSPLQTIGYQEFLPYFKGEAMLEEVVEKIVHNTLNYAKRQRTWFRRNKDIHWICNQAEGDDLITTMLNN